MTEETNATLQEPSAACRAIVGRMRQKTARQKRDEERDALAEMGNMADQVASALMDLMRRSESDSVRVAAAKALMDKILQKDQGEEEAKQRDDDERAGAITEAAALLAEFAETKKRLATLLAEKTTDTGFDGVSQQSEVDQDGTA